MRTLATALFLALFIVACTKTGSKPASEKLPPRIPTAVLVNREIRGPILRQTLSNPTGLAIDFRGDIYLCDQGNNRVIKFRKDLQPLRDRGGYGSQAGLFSAPQYVSIDNQINIWVSDAQNRRIVRMDSELNFVDEIPFSDPGDPFRYGTPSGVAVTSFGALWVADRELDRIVLFDNIGQFDKLVGDFGASGGQLQEPEKLVNDNDEEFYVCDTGNRRVAVYDSYGTLVRSLVDGTMEAPVAVTLDRRGVAWVLDQLAVRLFCFDSEGKNLAEGGVELVGGTFQPVAPSDLVFMSEDSLLVSDGGANRLFLCNVIYR